MRLGLVGKNISYSRSPSIHSEFAKSFGLEDKIIYSLEEVGEDLNFKAKILELKNRNFLGCNITVPYKQEAFELVKNLGHDCSERVERAGAANCFKFNKDGKIFADNTDGIGLIRDLKSNLNFELKNTNILIFGAGGAVRGILGSLIQEMNGLGSIVIVNRTVEKAQELVKIFKKDFEHISASHDLNQYENLIFDLVIDGTSLRNKDKNINLKLNKNSLVYDLKYCAESETETSFMAWGRNHGAPKISDGLGMLVEQAAESFRIWTGLMPETQPVIERLKHQKSRNSAN